jgi:hypothetical protein
LDDNVTVGIAGKTEDFGVGAVLGEKRRRESEEDGGE